VAKSFDIAIVLGTFHQKESEIMLAAAQKAAAARGLVVRAVLRVPGSYEKPLTVKRQMKRQDIDGVVVLGIIERGETDHGRVMGQTVSDALVQLQLEFMKPLGFGIIGPGVQPSQIPPRLEPHAVAAVEALNVMLRQEDQG